MKRLVMIGILFGLSGCPCSCECEGPVADPDESDTSGSESESDESGSEVKFDVLNIPDAPGTPGGEPET